MLLRSSLALFLACALLAPAGAAASQSPGIGTSTGEETRSSRCPGAQALVGFVAAPGLLFGNVIVGRVHALCAAVPGFFSSPQLVVDAHIGNLGGRGHGERTRLERHRCPHGYVATGIMGRAGDLVDRLRLMCHRLDGENRRIGPVAYTGRTGGDGGRLSIVRCPRREYATGITGTVRTGESDVVDFLRLDCR
jgi:hypothetical protein